MVNGDLERYKINGIFIFTKTIFFFNQKKKSLFRAQSLYSQYMRDLDEYLAPPYADYYKIQQAIWKCIWMRYGNRVIRGKVPKAPTEDFDTVD